ncbi:hydantoinase B/oxoprolinase family protein [Frankia sp. CNm7]|uniref:Hydantoinase B/oxoprolinase family protein n=1 Tax=Frankia nepalensis TaxID=1836974 RepID=A0A937RMY4_9ACTN|nr:hydantoinase B/oxoprolinase family protein [Frankia nepalensis]MBL7497707.1 hydantoinase B/oxoprolinase family protein [Frankia nepalensis]MBL7514293.1 hydantoinase B/oxoprolinase family protein [Frankia nepalensis]MBL7523295.1 hydantoinase B/oxoprolinase family protein [Frankia nepalensis]MBL7630249.1 hydantoinase B/oxoprolinase family protein [Frankia nepalensis]
MDAVSPGLDPVTLSVLASGLAGIAEEMGTLLVRSAYSSNIKERRDCSAALFDADGRMVAQAAHVPVHLGALYESVRVVAERGAALSSGARSGPESSGAGSGPESFKAGSGPESFKAGSGPESFKARSGPGDVWVLNDPFAGGNHLPDVTLVSPITLPPRAAGRDPKEEGSGAAADWDGEVIGYAATRAHHSDMGGMRPGSMPADSREIFAEGLIIPPVRLIQAGEWQDDILELICANSRTPDLRRGDLRAQAAANRLAGIRLAELAERYGAATVLTAFAEVLRYGERRGRALVALLPDGRYEAASELEGDGADDVDIPLRVAVTVAGDSLTVDFTGTSPAVRGNVNCPRAVTRSACCFALRVLLPDDVPANDGTYAPLTVVTEPGSLVDARRPSAVVAGNVETSQRIADTVLIALGQAVAAARGPGGPEEPAREVHGPADEATVLPVLPAQGQGTMNNLVIGGDGWTYYETLAGGAGASARGPGPSGVHVGMTNTLNTPIEALELEYPLRVERYELDETTAGAGLHPGGAGLVRAIRALAPATLSVLTDRRRHAPQGAAGGGPGAVGHDDVDGEPLPPKASRPLAAGSVVTIRTPGGGGWGPPPAG